LFSKFDIKDLGELKYFLGMKVEQNKEIGAFWIGQPAYTENLLKRLHANKYSIQQKSVQNFNLQPVKLSQQIKLNTS